jgi:multiple sugar transport system ATP-binding protein
VVQEAGPAGLVLAVGEQHWIAHADAGAAQPGMPVTLGIRPEHVRVGEGSAHALVVHVERLGEHSVLHLQAPGTASATLLAKSARDDVAVGDALPYELPPAALHVFGPDGRALRRPREPDRP